jgi:acyl-CoA synthetase (AMP-forming)/AMP-acid ligase II
MILGRCLARNARLYPQRAAVIDANGRRLTYAEFETRVNRLANALLALGIGKNSRLAVLDRNSIEYLEVYFAAGLIGAWLVPVNFQLKPADIAYRLCHADVNALFLGAEFVPKLHALARELPSALRDCTWVFGNADGLPSYEENLIAAGGPERPEVSVAPEDVLYLGYTSGTTGPSKGAMVSHRAIVVGYLYKALDYRLSEADIALCPGPFWHSAPRDFASLALYLGGTCVVTPRFAPQEYFELVQRHRVTYSFLVPTMLQMLTSHEGNACYDASSLRVLISGGSPLPTAVKEQVLARFGPILSEFYGATETRIITSITPAELAERKRSVGRPIRDVELRILDERGEPVPVGTPGEIYVRGPGLFSGYYNDPAATSKSHLGEWFSLGDIGRLDADGYLYLVDRKADVIISGGENIYPNDIEEVLMTAPGVKEAAVIGVPDPTWGELVTAIVVPASGATPEPHALIAHCAQHLPAYMKPRRIEFVEALPRNESGKLLRRVLREPYWKRAEAAI